MCSVSAVKTFHLKQGIDVRPFQGKRFCWNN